jgi:raffinose/stachyose/melibiose transport system permease protein
MRLHGKLDPYLFLILPLCAYLMVVLIPIIFSMYYSFMEWNGIRKMEFTGLKNYAKMFTDRNLLTCIVNNLKFTALATMGQVGGGLLLAILVQQIGFGQNLLRVILFTPVIISGMAIAQTFKKLLSITPDGVVNAVLGLIGLSRFKTAFLSEMHLTLYVMVILDSFKFCGLYLVVFHAAFSSLDKSIIEAAVIDGTKEIQLYTRIRLPMVRGIIINSVVLAVIGTLKAFEMPYILTNGGPGYASELMATYMYKTAFNSMNYGYGSVLSLFIVVECIVFLIVFGRLTSRKD